MITDFWPFERSEYCSYAALDIRTMVCTQDGVPPPLRIDSPCRHKGLKSRANALMFLATLIMFSVAVSHWSLTMVFFMNTMLTSIDACGPTTGVVSDFVAREWLPLINVSSLSGVRNASNETDERGSVLSSIFRSY